LTLQQLGSLGEFLAAIATLATLIYLALQIRQNTRATRSAFHHAITDSMNHGNLLITQDAEVARIWVTGNADCGALTEEERERYGMLLLSYFHVFDTLHYQARVGAGDRELLIAEERGLAHLFTLPGVREWWDENPYAFSPEFRIYIEQFRSATPANPS
jgi:hypothetical protein